MNNIKYGILAFGVLGVISWFIPLGDLPSMFTIYKEIDAGSLGLVMGGFAAAAVMGAMALKGPMQRWQAIVAAVGFGLFFLKFRAQLGDMFKAPLAAKLMIISALGGVVCSIIAIAKPGDEA